MMDTLGLFYRLLKYSKEGKLLEKTELVKSRSFVIQFLEAMYGCNRDDVVSITAMSGVEIDWYNTKHMETEGLAGSGGSFVGIQAGSGTAVVTNVDYAMATRILDGVAANQIQYQAMSLILPVVNGDYVEYVQSRTLINASGGTITIREIGLAAAASTTAALNSAWLAIRDVLASAYEVANSESVVIQYVIKTQA